MAISNAVTEASASKNTLRETDGYKNSYKKYYGTAGAVGAGAGVVGAAAIAKDIKTGDKVHEGTAVPTTAATTATPVDTKKSSSRSRSRGPLGLFRQTKDKTEANMENAKEEKAVAKEHKKEERLEEGAIVGGTGMCFFLRSTFK